MEEAIPDEPCDLDKQQREILHQKLLAKLSSSTSSISRKRKHPTFPDDIVNKRVRHICLDPSGEELVTYMGHVVRESSQNDIEELMEEVYRSNLEKNYKFYTVIYDPPYNQLYCYPLQKE